MLWFFHGSGGESQLRTSRRDWSPVGQSQYPYSTGRHKETDVVTCSRHLQVVAASFLTPVRYVPTCSRYDKSIPKAFWMPSVDARPSKEIEVRETT
jgi:fibronectin type 3 domain-containing protein